MKVTVDVDCTPEEARRFMGLPDLTQVHEAYVSRLTRVVEEGLQAGDIDQLVKNWSPMGEASFAMWRQLFEKMSGVGGK